MSSTSLGMPPPRRFDDHGEKASSRPSTAHSTRGSGDIRPPLNLNPVSLSISACGGSPRSPLGQYELASPVRSDSESLLGDEPDKIADEIFARIGREDDLARTKAAPGEKRPQQKRSDANSKGVSAVGVGAAYPSPPASVEGEPEIPLILKPGPSSSLKPQPVPCSQGVTFKAAPRSSISQDWRCRYQMDGSDSGGVKGAQSAKDEEVPASPKESTPDSHTSSDEPASGRRERSHTDGNLKIKTQMLSPQVPREPVRGATVPGAKPPRSPLFQHISSLDMSSDEEDESQKPTVDHRAADSRYGLPSPPLSHRQRPSDEHESEPVIRTVEAKRDTVMVGPGRGSLGCQIEQFERSLQQAQAMSALEMGSGAAGVGPKPGIRSRTASNASSNYSDISQSSPVNFEQPLFSPQPFPLSPRPAGAAGRVRTGAADLAPPGRPTLEVLPESPLGQLKQNAADRILSKLENSESRPGSPAGGASTRSKMGAAPQKKPTLGDYGNVKANSAAAASLAGRTHRPSPDEYGVSTRRRDSPHSAQGSFGAARGHSPMLKNAWVEQQVADDPSSAATSRTNSPSPVGSYSVFSPPPPPPTKRTGPARSAKPEWYGPAPTVPPTSPLPIPERSARRKNTQDTTTTTTQRQPQQTPAAPDPESPGLASSPRVVPDTSSNPNWPLPAPSTPPPPPSSLPSPSPGDGFSARRSLLRDARAPPAPLNIAATRYADDVIRGPWTPDPPAAAAMANPPVQRPKTAGGNGAGEGDGEPLSPYGVAPPVEDRSAAIGLARGLSIKYDRVRDVERRIRGQERVKRMAACQVVEEEAEAGELQPPFEVTIPELWDRLRRPSDGLRSPTGIADEQGVRFI